MPEARENVGDKAVVGFILNTWLVEKGGANFLEQSEHIEAKVIRTRNTLNI